MNGIKLGERVIGYGQVKRSLRCHRVIYLLEVEEDPEVEDVEEEELEVEEVVEELVPWPGSTEAILEDATEER